MSEDIVVTRLCARETGNEPRQRQDKSWDTGFCEARKVRLHQAYLQIESGAFKCKSCGLYTCTTRGFEGDGVMTADGKVRPQVVAEDVIELLGD